MTSPPENTQTVVVKEQPRLGCFSFVLLLGVVALTIEWIGDHAGIAIPAAIIVGVGAVLFLRSQPEQSPALQTGVGLVVLASAAVVILAIADVNVSDDESEDTPPDKPKSSETRSAFDVGEGACAAFSLGTLTLRYNASDPETIAKRYANESYAGPNPAEAAAGCASAVRRKLGQ